MLISQKRLVVVIDERKKSAVKGLWQQLLALLLTYSPSYLSARQRTLLLQVADFIFISSSTVKTGILTVFSNLSKLYGDVTFVQNL